jgi:hypothetical protein
VWSVVNQVVEEQSRTDLPNKHLQDELAVDPLTEAMQKQDDRQIN